jgi:hypothetical protein
VPSTFPKGIADGTITALLPAEADAEAANVSTEVETMAWGAPVEAASRVDFEMNDMACSALHKAFFSSSLRIYHFFIKDSFYKKFIYVTTSLAPLRGAGSSRESILLTTTFSLRRAAIFNRFIR